MLSPTHLVLLVFLLLVALVVFGPKRLPELGSSVGKAIQEFKKASVAAADEVKTVANATAKAPDQSTPTTAETRTILVTPSASGDGAAETDTST
jgi:sec-independent protein translocase protein TatA